MVTRQALDQAVKAGDLDAISRLAQTAVNQGIDLNSYTSRIGQKPPNPLQQIINQQMGTQPEQPATPLADATLNLDNVAPEPEPALNQRYTDTLKSIFTPEFVARAQAKQATGIDVGEQLPEQQSAWLQSYQQMRKTNPTMQPSQIIEAAATQHGFIPEWATHLKDLSKEDRIALSESTINRYMNDQQLNGFIQQYFPAEPGKSGDGSNHLPSRTKIL